MKYAIKGGLFLGGIQFILFLIDFIINKIPYLNTPKIIDLFIFIIKIICQIPTRIIIIISDNLIKIPVEGGYEPISYYFKLTQQNLFTFLTYNGWVFSTVILILIGSLIGFIYGKIKERNNINY